MRGYDLLARKEIGDFRRVDLQSRGTAELKCVRDLRSIHEAIPNNNAPAARPDPFAGNSVLNRNPRGVSEFHRKKDVPFMQHLVVLEAMKQCMRRGVDRGRHEHSCARYSLRWMRQKGFD